MIKSSSKKTAACVVNPEHVKTGKNRLEIKVFYAVTPCSLVGMIKSSSKKPAACVVNPEHVKTGGNRFLKYFYQPKSLSTL
jgi:hypothetical protein